MPGVLLEVESVPGNRNKLVLTMTDGGLDISGVTFGWAEIDRVRYGVVDRHVNGAYMGTTCVIEVGNAARKRMRFALDSGTTGALRTKIDHERRDRNRTEWAKAVEILDERVCIRLVTGAVTAVRGGGTTEFAGLRLDAQGVHKGGLLRTSSVAWTDIAGTETRHPYLHILSNANGRPKAAIKLPRDGWNVVLLPRLITALSSSTR